jgi:hypothetical protein
MDSKMSSGRKKDPIEIGTSNTVMETGRINPCQEQFQSALSGPIIVSIDAKQDDTDPPPKAH